MHFAVVLGKMTSVLPIPQSYPHTLIAFPLLTCIFALELSMLYTRGPQPMGRGPIASTVCQEPGPHGRRGAVGKRAKLHWVLPITPHRSPSLALPPEPSLPPQTPIPCLWKNRLPRNRSLVPKTLGTAALPYVIFSCKPLLDVSRQALLLQGPA